MRNQELNLLTVFDAIMTEGSITRAAERLAMTQPAVSNAVARMRIAWRDELFIKHGRNIRPTQHAQNLWAQIRQPLKDLNEAVSPSRFDPATAKRTFRVATADIIVDIAWQPMRQLIEQYAPGIKLYSVPYTIVNGEELLNDAEVDLVFGAMVSMPGLINSEYLFNSKFVCAMRKDHPLAKRPMSVDEFSNADHLMVSLSGDPYGFTDQVMAQHGLRRKVAMTVNHFSVIGSLLADSNLIAIVPSSAVEKDVCEGRLTVTQTPIELPQTQIACFWHKRQEYDPGLIWLRRHLCNIIKQFVEEHQRRLDEYCDSAECQKIAG